MSNYLPVALGVFSLLACGNRSSPPRSTPKANAEHVAIARAASRPPTVGAGATFTGRVLVTPLFQANAHARAAGASVTFEPSARSAWHSHPAGQTLIVTAGTGWVQQWGGAKQEIRTGDVIWTPPGVKHWHGATALEGMTHIAVQEHVNGKVVDSLEHVSDEQYRR